MRIAICGQTYYPGNNGQAIFTIHLAEGLVRVGHEVAVIIPSEDIHTHHQVINGVQIYQVRSIPFEWIHPGTYFTPIPDSQMMKIMKAFRPDVLHIQDHYFLCRSASIMAQRLSIPVMGTNHFLPENLLPYLSSLPIPRKTKISILWKLMLWTYNLLEVVATPTETAARILSGQKIHAPIVPISCGVDTNWFHPNAKASREDIRSSFGLDANLPTFLYVGRLDREKRIDLSIRGLALLRKKSGIQAQLAIAGQGKEKSELMALANQLGIAGWVHFLGYVPSERLPDLYRCADLFTMPSPEELQSIATLEAMACGLPILAANARALPELVTYDVNGALFEPGQPESVASKMVWLLENSGRWARMGSASRSRAVAHSVDNTVRRYEDLYRHLGGIFPHPMRRSGVVKSPVAVE